MPSTFPPEILENIVKFIDNVNDLRTLIQFPNMKAIAERKLYNKISDENDSWKIGDIKRNPELAGYVKTICLSCEIFKKGIGKMIFPNLKELEFNLCSCHPPQHFLERNKSYRSLKVYSDPHLSDVSLFPTLESITLEMFSASPVEYAEDFISFQNAIRPMNNWSLRSYHGPMSADVLRVLAVLGAESISGYFEGQYFASTLSFFKNVKEFSLNLNGPTKDEVHNAIKAFKAFKGLTSFHLLGNIVDATSETYQLLLDHVIGPNSSTLHDFTLRLEGSTKDVMLPSNYVWPCLRHVNLKANVTPDSLDTFVTKAPRLHFLDVNIEEDTALSTDFDIPIKIISSSSETLNMLGIDIMRGTFRSKRFGAVFEDLKYIRRKNVGSDLRYPLSKFHELIKQAFLEKNQLDITDPLAQIQLINRGLF